MDRQGIDRARMALAFNARAHEYDRFAVVQKTAANILNRSVNEFLETRPDRILDIGCGTGYLTGLVKEAFMGSEILGMDIACSMAAISSSRTGACCVNGDALEMPFADSAFDLLVSASTLQWIDDLEQCFRECRRILRSDGSIFMTLFTGGTLHELRDSFASAVAGSNSASYLRRLHRFRKAEDVSRLLEESGFSVVNFTVREEMIAYGSMMDLLGSIKGIGAGPAQKGAFPGGLGWRRVLSAASDCYERKYGCDKGIPATYEITCIGAVMSH